MLERLTEQPSDDLGLDQYLDDFESHFWEVGQTWKLERQQTFREPDVPSWVAMDRGDWATSLQLAEQMRGPMQDHQRRLDAAGIVQHRVRIVEIPLSPYLYWELHILKIRAELGERIRVVDADADAVSHVELNRALPEVLVLDDRVVYLIRYDATGVLDGAQRLRDVRTADPCRDEISRLFERGEDLVSFFERDVAHLTPPAGSRKFG